MHSERTSSRCIVKGVAVALGWPAPSIASIALVSGNSSSGPLPSDVAPDAAGPASSRGGVWTP